jgi:hypothetical protein
LGTYAKNRRWFLAAALAGTVAAAGWVGGQEEDTRPARRPAAADSPAQRPAVPESPAAGSPEPGAIDLEKLGKRVFTVDSGDLFPTRSWQPPPPPPEKRPPPTPQAPPLPFQFFGRYIEDGRTTVFLSQQDRTIVAQAGDTIDGAYRVDEITAAAVVLTYLPLKQKQTLPIGAIY